jgi:hypothetical protein
MTDWFGGRACWLLLVVVWARLKACVPAMASDDGQQRAKLFVVGVWHISDDGRSVGRDDKAWWGQIHLFLHWAPGREETHQQQSSKGATWGRRRDPHIQPTPMAVVVTSRRRWIMAAADDDQLCPYHEKALNQQQCLYNRKRRRQFTKASKGRSEHSPRQTTINHRSSSYQSQDDTSSKPHQRPWWYLCWWVAHQPFHIDSQPAHREYGHTIPFWRPWLSAATAIDESNGILYFVWKKVQPKITRQNHGENFCLRELCSLVGIVFKFPYEKKP